MDIHPRAAEIEQDLATLTMSFVRRNAVDKQETKMATNQLNTNRPVLYWLTLAIMFAAFAAVVLS
jgi:hypothetical protein